jgi:hypothetical protein
MNASDIRPVSSKEHELIPTDIFAVAAHEYKEGLEAIHDDAKKAGVSPERLAYTIMLKQYSDPRLVRIRAGNTLFTIAGMPRRMGYVSIYNGDTPNDLIENLEELVQSANKMGFNSLVGKAEKEDVQSVTAFLKRKNNEGFRVYFNTPDNVFSINTNKRTG